MSCAPCVRVGRITAFFTPAMSAGLKNAVIRPVSSVGLLAFVFRFCPAPVRFRFLERGRETPAPPSCAVPSVSTPRGFVVALSPVPVSSLSAPVPTLTLAAGRLGPVFPQFADLIAAALLSP